MCFYHLSIHFVTILLLCFLLPHLYAIYLSAMTAFVDSPCNAMVI